MFDIQRIVLILLLFSWPSNAESLPSKHKKGSNTTEEAKLICANVIFRHGQRNINDAYPNDPWRSARHWPEGFGKLTMLGQKQAFELGQFLRRRYDSILDDTKNVDDVVYIRSTDTSRTLMTASVLAAALFPSKNNDEVLNENLPWKPVPIHSVSYEEEFLLKSEKPCPRYNRAKQQHFNSPEMNAFRRKHKSLMKYLEDKSGDAMNGIGSVGFLYEILYIENDQNKTLPDWAKAVFSNGTEFEDISNIDFIRFSATPLLARFSAGFLLREILQSLADKLDSKSSSRPLWLYSAHDTTIATVLYSLGLFELHSPPFACSLHFELYKTKNDHYLQIFYRNTSDENPMPLKIPKCGTKCSLNKFYRIYEDIIPAGEYGEECQLPLYLRLLEGNDIEIPAKYLIVAICINILLAIITVIFCKFCSRKRGIIDIRNCDVKKF